MAAFSKQLLNDYHLAVKQSSWASLYDQFIEAYDQIYSVFAEKEITVTNSFDLIIGFASGTAVVEGPQFSLCIDYGQTYATVFEDIIVDLAYEFSVRKDDYDTWPYLLIFDQVIWLMYNYYNLADDCYYGAFENFDALGDYALWIENPIKIRTNSILNAGFIYTNCRDIFMAVLGDERSHIETNYDLGLALG